MSSFVACGTTDNAKDDNSSNVSTNSSIDENVTYVYGYAPLSYAQYWAGELDKSVEELSKSSDKTDSEGVMMQACLILLLVRQQNMVYIDNSFNI